MRKTVQLLPVLLSLLQLTIVDAQDVRSAKKVTDSAAPLDFDKKTTMLIKFSGKQEVTNVSYVKLIRKKSLIETVRRGLEQDKKLQKRYPYHCTDCVDPATGKFSLSKYTVNRKPNLAPNFGFHSIPEKNFYSHGDSLWVTFGEKSDYKFTRADLYNKAYYREINKNGQLKKVKRKLVWAALDEQYQFLEPNSRYALLVFVGNAPAVTKIFDFIDSYYLYLGSDPMGAAVFSYLADKQYQDVEQQQLAITKYNSFIPPWSYCSQVYKDSLAKYYTSIRKSQANIANSAAGGAAIFPAVNGNAVLSSLLPFVRRQYNRPLRDNPAPALVALESAISNLFNGSRRYLENVIVGKISILQPMDDQFEQNPDSLKYNLQTSAIWLDSIYIQLNQFNMGAPPAGLPAVQQAIENLKALIAKNLREAESIHKNKTARVKTLNRSFQSPFIIDESTIINNIQTRGDLVLIPDFGVIYYGFVPFNANKQFMSVSPYFGVEVNWRPLDRNNTFRFIPHIKWYSLERWSTMVGVTLISVASPGKTADLFSKTSLMLGMGYRLGSAIRIIGGALFFDNYQSYFSIQKKLAVTPFAGLSIDLSFQKIFGPVINAFK